MENNYIVNRRLKHHKLRRQARRGQILVRRIFKFVRFCFILFIFYSIFRLGATRHWFLPNDVYEKQIGEKVEILGNSIVTNEKILYQMKEIPLEKKQIFKIDPKPIENKIEELVPIKRAYIRRFAFPARLVVMIEELTPAITIAPSEDVQPVVAFAITGELITRDFLPLPDESDVFKILTYGNKGDDYDNWDIERIEYLYKLGSLIEEYSGEQLLYIDLRNPHNAFAQIESVKIKLGELDQAVFERVKSIRDILPQISHLIDKIQYVDLSWKDSKYLKME